MENVNNLKFRMIKGVIWGLIIGIVWGKNLISKAINKTQVLASTVEVTSTNNPSPTENPTTIPTPKPSSTPKPTNKPSPTPKPALKYSSEEIYGFTNNFGGQYGVDPNVLRHIAICESGFKPSAHYYIYAGLYQYDSTTWKRFRQKMGKDSDPDLRYDAKEAVQTTAYVLSLGYKHLWPNCYPK